jgi:multisubunit Na+/H+ antiporter MnhB subunit
MMRTLENRQKKAMAMAGMLSIAGGLLLAPGLGQRALVVFGAGLVFLCIADWHSRRGLGE